MAESGQGLQLPGWFQEMSTPGAKEVGLPGTQEWLDMLGLGKQATPGLAEFQELQKQLPKYFEPYMQAGMAELPNLQSQYSQLTRDPSSVLSHIGEGYHQSPGFQFSVDQATQAANRAGATSGMAGSPAEQASLAKTVTGLSDQDYNQYLSHALGLYGQGLAGEQGLYDTGFQATSNLADSMSRAMESQAQLQYASSASKQQGLGSLIGAGAGAIAAFI